MDDLDTIVRALADIPLFDALPDLVLLQLAKGARRRELPGGATLFEEGSPSEGMFVLVRGRLRALRGGQVVGWVVPGEPVGEVSLLGGAPRGATIEAVRDSVVLELPPRLVEDVLLRDADALLVLTRALARRLGGAQPPARPHATLALLHAGGDAPDPSCVRSFAAALSRFWTVAVVDEAAVGPRRGEALEAWLAAQEEAHDFLLLVGRPALDDWTRRCIRSADAAWLFAPAAGNPALNAVERCAYDTKTLRAELVLVHPPGDQPTGTARWLADRPVSRHHHVARGSVRDQERLARFAAGRPVGLVLAGGGALGAGHAGAIQALEEAGIPVDYLGGTSMGAAVAIGRAQGYGAAAMRAFCREAMVRRAAFAQWTAPVHGALNPRVYDQALREFYGARDLRDAWLNVFACSTNLTSEGLYVHDRGPAWEAVRCSTGLPGLLPPYVVDGQFLVDGGLLDNLPVLPARERFGGSVIALTLRGPSDPPRTRLTYADLPDPSRALLRAVGRRPARAEEYPTLGTTLMGAMMAASNASLRGALHAADVTIVHPRLPGMGFTEFERVDELVAFTHQETQRELARRREPLLDELRAYGTEVASRRGPFG